jgi:hypothetical protein
MQAGGSLREAEQTAHGDEDPEFLDGQVVHGRKYKPGLKRIRTND